MNDFTKDELQIILLDMDTYIRQNKILKESPIHKELRLKIQAMINNYCEHKEKAATSDEDGNMVVMCGRCNSVLWHEKD